MAVIEGGLAELERELRRRGKEDVCASKFGLYGFLGDDCYRQDIG